MMMADLVLVIVVTIPVLVIGWFVGVGFVSGFGGVIVFLALSGLWVWPSPASPTP
jgi:ABC-2 type transport system permease protein